MKRVSVLIGALFALAIVACVLVAGCWALSYTGEAGRVAREEFGPRAMLQKYEWLKDAAAQLDKKRADIDVFSSQLAALELLPPESWDRIDKEQRMLLLQQLAGIKSSHNGLSAKYNAQMAKFNWRFAEAGRLPQGATDPLPREFKPYVTQ